LGKMGVCASQLTPEEQEIIKNASKLEQKIKASQNINSNILKVLLLGTGESGKSTVFKQMQILAGVGFSDFEKVTFRQVIRKNIVQCMQTLIMGAQKFNLAISPNCAEDVRDIMALDSLTADFWDDDNTPGQIDKLWMDSGILAAFDRRNELQLLDSAQHWFEDVARIGDPNFEPTVNDILTARLRTSGVVEKQLRIKNNNFLFLDVGGQRNERRKWIHCFEGVTAILFIVAISEFDQYLFEDDTKNRMEESAVHLLIDLLI
jgi:guanine nucleotide-binding protein G(i) subunit alpha